VSDLTGQIGLVPHPQSLVEWGIEWWTRSTVHHAVIAISETECVSAEPNGARLRPIDYYPDAYWSHFDLTEPQKTAAVKFATDHIGTPYGWLTDIAIGISFLLHQRTPKFIENYIASDGSMCCSQLCDAAYVAADIHLFNDGRLPGTVYPGSFAPIWRANHWMP
jgi:uncharacterized protein YycO